jgi:hypothetical protein
MADNYTVFATVIDLDNEEQADWVRRQLEPETLNALRDYEYDHQDQRPIPVPGFAADIALAEHILSGGDAQFDFALIPSGSNDGKYNLELFAEECGDTDAVAIFAQAFLKKFAPGECFSFCWAAACSKMREDEFGGGGIFVTADEITYINSFQWCAEQQEAFRAKHGKGKPV